MISPAFIAERTEATMSENGAIHLKVTFVNGVSHHCELNPVLGVDLIGQIAAALEQLRPKTLPDSSHEGHEVGGS